MKRLLLTLCCTLATALFADTWTDPETNITWTYTLSNGTVSLGGGWGSPAVPTSHAGALTIPATINGSPVGSLNDDAFYGCSSLTSLVIPEGVTSIGSEAFYGCSSLTSVVIPEGVTAIELFAFYGCSSLTSVVIPESVTFIGSWAFCGCSSLTSVDIPAGVTSIKDHAFCNCSSLTSVVIPERVTYIGYSAFSGCSSLTSVVIPEGVTSIGERSFDSCSRLKEVTFLGDVPEGWGNVPGRKIYFSQAYAGKWNAVLSAAQRWTILELISKAGVTVTAEMTTPKTMRVTYAVESELPTVKVRAVAWKDGVRSFANIVPVKTAAEGSPEAVPNGGEVATGLEHTFVWQVSADWAMDLDKVAMEILVEEGTLLPQEKITIPALNDHPKMTITRNRLFSEQLFDALVWCYAEGDEALVVTDGVVKTDGKVIAEGSWVATWDGNKRGDLPNGDWGQREWYATTLLNYLYGKMGYKVLAGEDLAWARAATRLELADSGLDQVSVKIAEE